MNSLPLLQWLDTKKLLASLNFWLPGTPSILGSLHSHTSLFYCEHYPRDNPLLRGQKCIGMEVETMQETSRMKKLSIILSLTLITFLGISGFRTTPDSTKNPPTLYDTIVALDSRWEDAYNNCKMNVMEELISEDLEFYHDQGGLMTSKQKLNEALTNNICGKVKRELKKGSIEVYEIKGFGVQSKWECMDFFPVQARVLQITTQNSFTSGNDKTENGKSPELLVSTKLRVTLPIWRNDEIRMTSDE
jgi:hypothetical protein